MLQLNIGSNNKLDNIREEFRNIYSLWKLLQIKIRTHNTTAINHFITPILSSSLLRPLPLFKISRTSSTYRSQNTAFIYRAIFFKIMLLSILQKLFVNGCDAVRHSSNCSIHTLTNSVSKGGHELSSHATHRSPQIICVHFVSEKRFVSSGVSATTLELAKKTQLYQNLF